MPTFLLSSNKKVISIAMKSDIKKFEEKISEEVSALIESIVENEDMELVDVEFRKESNGRILRVLIDKAGGVDIDDCSQISHQVSDLLDAKDVIPYSYKLEVSSPGLNRPLKKEGDFKRVIGEKVSLKTRRSIEKRKNFTGKLIDFRENALLLDIDGNKYIVPHSIVAKAHLEYDFNKEKKQRN